MASFVDKKQNFATQLVALASEQLRVARDIDELVASYFANGFNSGANVYVDADFSAANKQLTSAMVVACITTLQAVQTTLTTAQRDNLRKMGSSGLP